MSEMPGYHSLEDTTYRVTQQDDGNIRLEFGGTADVVVILSDMQRNRLVYNLLNPTRPPAEDKP